MKKVILTILLLTFPLNCFAAQKPDSKETFKEKLIGMMVKTFAKTYIATVNLQKFKEKNIKKINKMDERKFQRVYTKIYKEMMLDLPVSFRQDYGITEQMTRDRAIAQINSFNKRKIFKLINSVPNNLIAKQFHRHREEFKKGFQSSPAEKKVDAFVDKVLEEPTPSQSL